MNHYSGDIMVFPFLKWSNYRKNILFPFYIFNFIPYQNSTISYETHKTHVTANIVKTKILGDQFCVTQKSEKKKKKKKKHDEDTSHLTLFIFQCYISISHLPFDFRLIFHDFHNLFLNNILAGNRSIREIGHFPR